MLAYALRGIRIHICIRLECREIESMCADLAESKAYCLYVTVQQRLRALAPGLTSWAVIEKMSAIQMIDVHLPTTVGRLLILSRCTQPEPGNQLLLRHLHLTLPEQLQNSQAVMRTRVSFRQACVNRGACGR